MADADDLDLPSDGMIELDEQPGGRRWRFDADFLRSTWQCRWGCDCVGILDTPAAELGQGCCSVGAELLDRDEARQVAALALTLDPARFQFHAGDDARLDSYFDAEIRRTLVVDGACVFLNRPGFAGGEGCALHLGAVDDGDSPIDWKPSVCWQLPLKIVEVEDGGVPVSLLRRWQRDDWGPGGATMAWLCTDPGATPSAYVGERRVVDSLAHELDALLGPSLFHALKRALDDEEE